MWRFVKRTGAVGGTNCYKSAYVVSMHVVTNRKKNKNYNW